MAGPAHPLRLILLAALLSPTARGQTAAPAAPAVAEPPAPSKLTKLFAGAPPKYDPPKPEAAASAPTTVGDRPRNGIIRLPVYIVREPRPIEENDVMTAKAKEDALVKRYVGEPTGLDVLLNKYTFNTLWKKIPLLGPNSDFAPLSGPSMTYSQRIALDYSKIEARRKYIEALGVSADVPMSKPAAKVVPTGPDDK